ncbi:hypothetical protein GJV85_11980 [Sulfurimonas aquatica]|uniref:YtkA-like domain-containing protein n=1 Tax=Sulfurimonas aquatica TaxID=2672570 RepID=A0A975GDP4_9BACT|nr:FixH family protein [Sulfurimonas aquatica]QSZ42802.1 hypothetical protein GJV85_11980 [Sulfurimonas aquatica]
MSKGRIWPYSIAASIILVFGFCVATIVVTQSAEIQESDAYMSKYQVADLNANILIQAKIEFDKKYNVKYLNSTTLKEDTDISYKISDKNGNAVNDAVLTLAISRPETNKLDQTLSPTIVENGVYTFTDAKFSKAGVWNLILKVEIGKNYRFLNIKSDTRNPTSYEY